MEEIYLKETKASAAPLEGSRTSRLEDPPSLAGLGEIPDVSEIFTAPLKDDSLIQTFIEMGGRSNVAHTRGFILHSSNLGKKYLFKPNNNHIFLYYDL